MNWKDKTILLTGGTGSFGKKFSSLMIEKYNPKMIKILSRDELKQYEMMKSLRNNSAIKFFLGDIRDAKRLFRIMDGVDIVVHAAALKQIPLCECNPFEAVKTNIIGAQNVLDAAVAHDVEKVMAISTDKAANPVNLYGATKLCMEKLCVSGNMLAGRKTKTRISCARYGNVIGSRGSIIPLFRSQRASGKVTITDKRMTRFWITLEQGVEFVINCIEKMHGGEIFVPKLPSMKITELKDALVPGCECEEIGIRPGEKLNEVLITEKEARHTVEFDDFYVIKPEFNWWAENNWKDGVRLEEGFRYASDTNKEWLPKKDLHEILKEL
jgi:UDP-N-acetylglucosamine 4,6-dehydratase